MMKTNAIVLLGALALAACSRDRATEMKEKTGTTTITGAAADAGVTVDEIRRVVTEHSSRGRDALSNVTIDSANGTVTLRGNVEDEATHREMVNAVRGMPNVKSVRDELKIMPKTRAPSEQGGMQGSAIQGGTMRTGDTKNTEAVRAHLKQEKALPAAVITDLIITDDGNMIVISGTVPDQATHDTVVTTAQKTPGVKGVRDQLKIKGE